MTIDELMLSKQIKSIEEQLNLLLCQNNLLIDIDTYEYGSSERRKYNQVKIKIYKEL